MRTQKTSQADIIKSLIIAKPAIHQNTFLTAITSVFEGLNSGSNLHLKRGFYKVAKCLQNRYASFRKKQKAVVNLLILLGNLVFFVIWGVLAWQDAEYNTNAWWFDAYGHMIFGFCWAFILLYWARKYLRWLYVPIPKWVLAFIIISAVNFIETFLWENFELVWDSWIQPNFFPYLAKAHKGSVDTMMDINFTAAAALVAMLLWGIYRTFYAWKWPNEAVEEMREEMIERNKFSVDEINSLQIEHRKFVRAKIKAKWEKIFQEK